MPIWWFKLTWSSWKENQYSALIRSTAWNHPDLFYIQTVLNLQEMPVGGNGREPGEAGRAIGLWRRPPQEWRREGKKDDWVEACLIAVYSNKFSKAVGAPKPSESHTSNFLPLAGSSPQVARAQLKHINGLQNAAGGPVNCFLQLEGYLKGIYQGYHTLFPFQ